MIGRPELAAVWPRGVHGRAEDEARELGVHGDERVGVDDALDQLEFGFEIVGPHFPDHDGFLFRIRIFAAAVHVWIPEENN